MNFQSKILIIVLYFCFLILLFCILFYIHVIYTFYISVLLCDVTKYESHDTINTLILSHKALKAIQMITFVISIFLIIIKIRTILIILNFHNNIYIHFCLILSNIKYQTNSFKIRS